MKKHFLTGLAILLPVVITIAIVLFLINLLTAPFVGIVSSLLAAFHIINTGFLGLSPEQLLIYSAKLLILILLFFMTVGLGILARWFLMSSLLKIGDQIIRRIPLVNTVYKTTKEIINTLFSSDQNSFKQVVIVPFPHADSFVLGLIARNAPDVCSSAVNEDLVSVFIPTTPNPTTGFLLMFKRKDLVLIDMTAEDAIKYIVSCGVILPTSSSCERAPA